MFSPRLRTLSLLRLCVYAVRIWAKVKERRLVRPGGFQMQVQGVEVGRMIVEVPCGCSQGISGAIYKTPNL
jgi:hypothetical protein